MQIYQHSVVYRAKEPDNRDSSMLSCSGAGMLHGKSVAGPSCGRSGQAPTTSCCASSLRPGTPRRSSNAMRESWKGRGPSTLPTETHSAKEAGILKPRSAGLGPWAQTQQGPLRSWPRHDRKGEWPVPLQAHCHLWAGASPWFPPQPHGTPGAPRTTPTSRPLAGHVRDKAALEVTQTKRTTQGFWKFFSFTWPQQGSQHGPGNQSCS